LDDIEILIKHFISKINQKLGTAIEEVDEESLALLKSYEWPGNIRELENIIERAINLASLDRQKIIQAQYLPTLQPGKFLNNSEELSLNQAVEDLEYQMISETLRRNNYNKAVTARSLNIHPSVLYRKLKKYEIS